MKTTGIQNCVLQMPDEELVKRINEKCHDKYSEEYIKKKLIEGMTVFQEHGVDPKTTTEIYHKALKILDFSKENLELKLSVFEYLGIQDRYVTHPADLIQSANLTYSRGMFLRETKGMVLVNDLFQKRSTFEKKYGNKIDNLVLEQYPFTQEVQEEIKNCRK